MSLAWNCEKYDPATEWAEYQPKPLTHNHIQDGSAWVGLRNALIAEAVLFRLVLFVIRWWR